jgi:hypothetical protein
MDDDGFAEQGDRAALDALTGDERAEISALAGQISSPCAYWELPGSSRAAVDQAVWLMELECSGVPRPDDDDG